MTVRELDYLAILLAHALAWEGVLFDHAPESVVACYTFARAWGIAPVVVDVMMIHGHERDASERFDDRQEAA